MKGLKKKFSVEKLNNHQQDAVLAELGPTLVVAGAGSGKTTVLVKRFEYLVKEKGIDPKKIIAISFSNKSIAAIRKKLKKVLDDVLTREDIGKMHVSTLHSFSKDLLRKYSGSEFKVCYDKLSTSIVRQIIEDYELENKAAWKMTRVLLELKDRKDV